MTADGDRTSIGDAGTAAIVTGAGQPNGIGLACARRLADDGVAVVLADLEPRLVETAVTMLRDSGAQAVGIAGDLTSSADREALIDKALTAFGRLDILVNNAASLAGSAPLLDTTDDEWQASFALNLLAPTSLIRSAIPHLRAAGGGSIVTVGSTASLGAEPGFGAYTAMKHGLVGMVKTVAAEFGADGIRSNIVCPGYIDTDMHQAANQRLAAAAGVTPAEIAAQRYVDVPLGRAGSPDEVASVVALLAGPAGAYVNGAVVPVTGGVPYGI